MIKALKRSHKAVGVILMVYFFFLLSFGVCLCATNLNNCKGKSVTDL